MGSSAFFSHPAARTQASFLETLNGSKEKTSTGYYEDSTKKANYLSAMALQITDKLSLHIKTYEIKFLVPDP